MSNASAPGGGTLSPEYVAVAGEEFEEANATEPGLESKLCSEASRQDRHKNGACRDKSRPVPHGSPLA